MSASDEIRIAEYEALRTEIATAVGEARTLERYALVAIGGIYAWYATKGAGLDEAAWWVPVVLVVMASLRSLALQAAIAHLGGYLWEVEKEHLTRAPAGWEHHRREKFSKRRWDPTLAPYVTTATLYWIGLLAATVYVACEHEQLFKTVLRSGG